MTTAPRNDSVPGRQTAVRLIFEYEGTDIRLVSRQRVEMVPPPGDPLHPEQDLHGFWVEVRDAGLHPLYRRVMHPPVRHDAEVFSDDPERSLARVPVDEPKGAFAVLVPDLADADHIALVSSPPAPGATAAPATEVARFALGPGADEAGTDEGGR
ncbi:hypothetical protein I5Q34_31805 [Streptomyces sp. AV19]|uniref:hypothetical protein n=1 Tax=Streptomyces sp. AV19 TaxID=2793068 RepID=UPI0018FE3385|nr:hypothetical protein [Streptomyces sp. AV19]MBH1938792.1 hypothetical protein [Streptomyces sp. AV19]MDG4534725.1 hypothetical protein [Streptomyces sp. AV19]